MITTLRMELFQALLVDDWVGCPNYPHYGGNKVRLIALLNMQEVRQNSFVLSNVTNVQMNGMEAPLLLECIHIVKIVQCSLFGIILNAKSSYKAQERRF